MASPQWIATTVNVLSLMLVQTIFAGYDVFSSAAFRSSSLNPWVFALFRDTIGGSILLSVAYCRRKDTTLRFMPLSEDFAQFLLVGFLGIWCSQGLSAVAVSLTTSDYVSLIHPVQTIVAFIGAVVMGSEPFDVRIRSSYGKVAAVVFTVGGAIFMVAMSSFSGSTVASESKNLFLGTMYLILQVHILMIHEYTR